MSHLAGSLRGLGVGSVEGSDFPDSQGIAWEQVTAISNTGAHLDALSRRTDILPVTFPTGTAGGSAGWVRPVAFVNDEMANDQGGT